MKYIAKEETNVDVDIKLMKPAVDEVGPKQRVLNGL
jgi:hypothetical protein